MARGFYLTPLAQSHAAQERAWRAADATTLHLLGLMLNTTMQRRRKNAVRAPPARATNRTYVGASVSSTVTLPARIARASTTR